MITARAGAGARAQAGLCLLVRGAAVESVESGEARGEESVESVGAGGEESAESVRAGGDESAESVGAGGEGSAVRRGWMRRNTTQLRLSVQDRTGRRPQ